MKAVKRGARYLITGTSWRAERVRHHVRLRAKYYWTAAECMLGRVYKDQPRERNIFVINTSIERLHRTKPWAGRMLVIQAEGLYHEQGAGWPAVPGTQVETVVIPGYHEDQRNAMAEPKVALVAEAVQRALVS
jgi:hypothetical protein